MGIRNGKRNNVVLFRKIIMTSMHENFAFLNSVSCGFSSLNKYLFGLLKVYDNKCGADDIQNILSRSE